MRVRTIAYRYLAILGTLGLLVVITGKAEAGIKVSNPTVLQTGDPTIQYSVSVYLSPGSSLSANLFQPVFTLNYLPGIDPLATVSIMGNSGIWGAVLLPFQFENVTINEPGGPVTYKNIVATSVNFFYDIGGKIKNTSSQDELLGTFTVTEPNSSLPLLPGGSDIPISYSIQGVAQSTPLQFTNAVPEPSSLVIVALVGLTGSGFALLRRRRRRAA